MKRANIRFALAGIQLLGQDFVQRVCGESPRDLAIFDGNRRFRVRLDIARYRFATRQRRQLSPFGWLRQWWLSGGRSDGRTQNSAATNRIGQIQSP